MSHPSTITSGAEASAAGGRPLVPLPLPLVPPPIARPENLPTRQGFAGRCFDTTAGGVRPSPPGANNKSTNVTSCLPITANAIPAPTAAP